MRKFIYSILKILIIEKNYKKLKHLFERVTYSISVCLKLSFCTISTDFKKINSLILELFCTTITCKYLRPGQGFSS